MEKMLIKGVAKDDDVARISVIGVPDQPGIAYNLFNLLASKKIDVDIILQSIGRDGTKDISFTVPENGLLIAMNVLQENQEMLQAKEINYNTEVAKVSIVGAGMQSTPGVAAKMFGALYDANINIKMISTSEIKISVLVEKDKAKLACNAIHNAFFPDN